MSGEHNEKVEADKLTVSIGGSIFKLKIMSRLTQDRPVQRVADADGIDHSFGAGNHSFAAMLFASTPDLSTINAWNVRDANGDLPVQTVIVTFPPKGGGSSVTATFTAKFPHLEIGHPNAEGVVTVALGPPVVITSDTITWA